MWGLTEELKAVSDWKGDCRHVSVSWAALWLEKAGLAAAGCSTLEPAGPVEGVGGGQGRAARAVPAIIGG